jgi:phosphatidylglycerol lysyltransferase
MNDQRLDRARELVMRFGWHAASYQIINPGIDLWFSSNDDAVIGFVIRHGVRVVAGAPVCDPARLAAVVQEFEVTAGALHQKVCYFCAEDRLYSLLGHASHHSAVVLGAQPAWDPRHWSEIIASRASLRAQLNRARNKHVVVQREDPERDHTLLELRRVLGEWLGTRGLPPLHFLVEPDTLERLFDRKVFVARRSGEIVAFLVASPASARDGWLIEQLVRGHRAPNGTAELLIDAVMRDLASEDYSYATLGLSPLSRRAPQAGESKPAWLRFVLRWVRAHGRRFYNFEGLDQFKAKFQPDVWEPVYAIANARTFPPQALLAIASAFSDRSLLSTLVRAVARAIGTEIRWMLGR